MKDIKKAFKPDAKILEEYKERARNMTHREFLEMHLKSCEGCRGYDNCHQDTKGHYGVIENTTLGLQIIEQPCNKRFGYSKTYGIDLNQYQDVHGKQNVIDLFNYNYHTGSNKGMFIYGDNTIGKTYLMCNLADRTRKFGKSIILISWIHLCKVIEQSMQDKNKGYVLSKFEECDSLFIDDLGAGGMTRWKINDVLFAILDYRKKSNLPTFITSNYTPKQLQNELVKIDGDEFTGKRILARIKQMCSWVKVMDSHTEINKQYEEGEK